MDDTQAFNGFPDDGIRFLHDLAENNERDWFNQHKATFQNSLQAPAQAFATELGHRLEGVTRSPMKHKIYRIYRDVRFSGDKTPYQTHVHMSLWASGDNDVPAFHFGLEAARLFFGCGHFAFSAVMLERYRRRIVDGGGAELQNIIAGFEPALGYRLSDTELKRVPAGFDKDHAQAALLRHKGVVIWYECGHPENIASAAFVDDAAEIFAGMRPLYDWLLALGE